MRRQQQGFNASGLQVRRAYFQHFQVKMPDNMTFQAAGVELVKALGLEGAKALILSVSNDPKTKEPGDCDLTGE